MKVYEQISRKFKRCTEDNNHDWEIRHLQDIADLCREHLPHGSGFDVGVDFIPEDSDENSLVFDVQYHHMDNYGGYAGWSEHTVAITPDLAWGFEAHILDSKQNEYDQLAEELGADSYLEIEEYVLNEMTLALDKQI